MINKPEMTSSLGLYIHIPFCIQRCHYCDFATYSMDQIKANQNYVDHLLLEADKRRNLFTQNQLKTIYFGGGTPSLLSGGQINQIITKIKKTGFELKNEIEITLEVNPKTLNPQKCSEIKNAGINRISLGCQSFNDKHLKICNREHNSKETLETIDLVKQYFDNYNLDLLFSLPGQSLSQLREDLNILKELDPPHISAYCLTLSKGHPMNQGRCSEEEQIEMFYLIFDSFREMGLKHYEISNFAKPGFESRHNNLYWTDQDYWGLGLSAHSYKKDYGFGLRFWNVRDYQKYLKQISELQIQNEIQKSFPKSQSEALKFHESLTDFCCSGLRLKRGISPSVVGEKFGIQAAKIFTEKAGKQVKLKNMEKKDGFYYLSEKGLLISNQIFSEFLFSESEIDKSKKNPLYTGPN